MYSVSLCVCAAVIAFGTVSSRTVPSPDCFNEHECCDVWSTGGHCSLNSRMTTSCKAACGFCRVNYNKQGCDDYHYECLERMRKGECQTNPDWMAENCRKSCRLCSYLKCGVAPARSPVTGSDERRLSMVNRDPSHLTGPKCPEGWHYHNRFCYKGFTSERTWEEARTECSRISLGTHLVAIESETENNFVHKYIVKDKARVQGWWIGIKRDREDSEKFITTLDQDREIVYDNFAMAEPNNGIVRDGCIDYWYDHENCVEMYAASEKKGEWNDAKCHERKPYICKQHQLGSKKTRRHY